MTRAFERSLRGSDPQDPPEGSQRAATPTNPTRPQPRPERSRSRGIHSETSSSHRRALENKEQVGSGSKGLSSSRGKDGRLAWNMGGKLNSLQAENERMAGAIESLERKVWQLSGSRTGSMEQHRGSSGSGLHASVIKDKLRQDHVAALDLIARQKEGLQSASEQIAELTKQSAVLRVRNAELELESNHSSSKETEARHHIEALEAELRAAKRGTPDRLDQHSSTATSILEKKQTAVLETREELMQSRAECHQLQRQLLELTAQRDMLLAGGEQSPHEQHLLPGGEDIACRLALERQVGILEDERDGLNETLTQREEEITVLSMDWCTQSDLAREQQRDQTTILSAIRELTQAHKFLKSGLASFAKRQHIGKSDELGITQPPDSDVVPGNGAATGLASPGQSVVWPHRHKRGIGLGLLELVEHCNGQLSRSLLELQAVSFNSNPARSHTHDSHCSTSPETIPTVPDELFESTLAAGDSTRTLPLPCSPELKHLDLEVSTYSDAKEKNALRVQLIAERKENAALRAAGVGIGADSEELQTERAKVVALQGCVQEQNELIATLNRSIEGLLAH